MLRECYVEKTWIQKIGILVESFDRSQNLQTTNACESWHASWNTKMEETTYLYE